MITKTKALPVMEAFYTIQGEGYHQGRAAYFIRLGGCDVGCVWCDVKESWDASLHPKISISRIVEEASKFPARLAVITGGEPAMYDLSELCNALHAANFEVNIETSGVYPLLGNLDWICFSPKKFKKPDESIYAKAQELKAIIYHKSDFAFAEEHAQKLNADCLLYLQPEWSKADEMLPLIIAYIQENPQWRISLQTHKWMQIP